MSGGVGPRQLHFQKKSEASEAQWGAGQRPVGLDQDSCMSKRTQTPKLKGTKIVCKEERVFENSGDL